MSFISDLQTLITKEGTLTNNKVSNFSYDSYAYEHDLANGTATYDFENHNNIPTNDPSVIKTNPTVVAKGFRSQVSTLPRMLINHIFGRVSYNLNKTVDVLNAFLSSVSTYLGAPNGFASLDSNGRIPYSQLPESAVELKGYWNASTNTPTLVDGTGTNGDEYFVDVAGEQDLGSGSQYFKVGDRVVYSGGIWKNIDSGSVRSVDNVVPDAQGDVPLKGTDIPVSADYATSLTERLQDTFINGAYSGRELKQALGKSTVAQVMQDLIAKRKAHNYRGIGVGDYIVIPSITINGETHNNVKMSIAGFDQYAGFQNDIGSTTTLYSKDKNSDFIDALYDGTKYVVLLERNSQTAIYTSTDLSSWTEVATLQYIVTNIVFANSYYYIKTRTYLSRGDVYISSDLINWSKLNQAGTEVTTPVRVKPADIYWNSPSSVQSMPVVTFVVYDSSLGENTLFAYNGNSVFYSTGISSSGTGLMIYDMAFLQSKAGDSSYLPFVFLYYEVSSNTYMQLGLVHTSDYELDVIQNTRKVADNYEGYLQGEVTRNQDNTLNYRFCFYYTGASSTDRVIYAIKRNNVSSIGVIINATVTAVTDNTFSVKGIRKANGNFYAFDNSAPTNIKFTSIESVNTTWSDYTYNISSGSFTGTSNIMELNSYLMLGGGATSTLKMVYRPDSSVETFDPAFEVLNPSIRKARYINNNHIVATDSGIYSGNTYKKSGIYNDIAFGNNLYVAIGNSGEIVNSSDLTTWTDVSVSAVTADLKSIYWNGSMFVITGENGTILTSSDGTNWTVRASGVTVTLNTVTYADKWVIGGNSGTVLVSADAVSWTEKVSTITESIIGSTYFHNEILLLAENNTVIKSADTDTWEALVVSVAFTMNAITSTAGYCVISGADKSIITQDTINWVDQPLSVPVSLSGSFSVSDTVFGFYGENQVIDFTMFANNTNSIAFVVNTDVDVQQNTTASTANGGLNVDEVVLPSDLASALGIEVKDIPLVTKLLSSYVTSSIVETLFTRHSFLLSANEVVSARQLPLYTLKPSERNREDKWWLQDCKDATKFCLIDTLGYARSDSADAEHLLTFMFTL